MEEVIQPEAKKAPPPRSIDVMPRGINEAVKPAELIQLQGHQDLSLEARRVITLLYRNASIEGIEPGRDYQVEMDLLKPTSHKGYERVEDAVMALMKTVVTVKLPSGGTRRVQLLGGNDMDDPDRPRGMLTYSFDKRLVAILEDSQIWGRLEIPVLMAFTTKYVVSLYENIAQLVALKYKTDEEYELADFRDLLGIGSEKYPRFGELNKHVIKPAVAEINALASFSIGIVPIKEGKRVTKIKVSWFAKDNAALREAYAEVGRTKIGRRARISDKVEAVLEPLPSMKGPQHVPQLNRRIDRMRK